MSKLEDIKARAHEASPGPWGAVRGSEYDGVDTLTGELTWDDHNGEVFKPADADFIAHARTDVPKLIAALEAVGKLTESWHEAYISSASEFNDIRDDAAYEIEQAITEALQ